MLGLRVDVRNQSAVVAALPQDEYLVVAGAAWSRGRPRQKAEWYFQSTGIDDRGDHLRWLWIREPSRRCWMDVTVGEVSAATPPRRVPRRTIDWRVFFKTMRANDLKRAGELEDRLRRLRVGVQNHDPAWVSRPPMMGFRVTLNGIELGRIGVADPGTVSIDVVVRRRSQKQSAFLNVHGGDHVGSSTWRWREWSWSNRRLEIGDRVRFEVVAPVRLSPSHVREDESTDVTDAPNMTRELSKLRRRLRSSYYQTEATFMLQAERERLPARRYARNE